MTGFFRWILSKVRIALFGISWILIMVLGSCLDSPALGWKFWVLLLGSIIAMWVAGHGKNNVP